MQKLEPIQREVEESRGLVGNEQSRNGASEGPPVPAEMAISAIGRPAPQLPPDLKTPGAKLVYAYVWMIGRTDVDVLSQVTLTPQIQLFPVLEALVSRGHVERDGSTFSIPAAE